MDGYNGKRSQSHPLALVAQEDGQVKGLFEVPVARFLDRNALLGRDLGIDSVLQLACDARITSNNCTEPTQSAIKATKTRAQAARKPMTVPQLYRVHRSPLFQIPLSILLACPGLSHLSLVDVSNQGDSVDQDFHPRTLENSMRDLFEPELPIPPLTAGMTSCDSLIDEHKKDDSA